MIDGHRSSLVCHIEDPGIRLVFIYLEAWYGTGWEMLLRRLTSRNLLPGYAVKPTASRRVHRPVHPSTEHISAATSGACRSR